MGMRIKTWAGGGCRVLLAGALLLAFLLSGCGGKGADYRIEVEGALSEPGVITYLGHTMNVYKDQASNPCGDCALQPVSVFVGDGAAAVAAAIGDALENDFGGAGWALAAIDGGSLTLKRADSGGIGAGAAAPGAPTAPAGLTIKGGFGGNLKTGGADGSGSGGIGGTGAQIRNIKQFDGTLSEVPLVPERIAAVYGPSYEALVLLGAEDRIVARADVQTENFPWAEEVFANIGGLPVLEDVHAAVNIEQLLTYKPDLVYTFPRPNETAVLDKARVAWVEGATTKSLADVKELLRVFASGIGAEAQGRADVYAAWFDERLALVAGRTAGLPESGRPKVYYAGTDILTTYGRGSDIIEAIETAGGTAVSKELEGGNRINTDAEKLAAWNPDWIFIDHCGMSGSEGGAADEVAARAYANPKYAGISAIRDKQVVLTPSGVFYWDMGLQKILLVEYMAKTIHPELFEDLDMAAEVQDFYQTIFGYPLTRGQAEQILARQAP
ncbi:MAG: ABC transporter substrate-binding protein [Clostridiales Family XIII bacterium]|nr:ABC transporter substrate-binding protein [Clostridiales Family XIII bacterium]